MKILLEKLVAFKTVSTDLKANKEALLFCQAWLSENKVKSEIITLADKPVLVWGAELKSTKYLFNTHIDVVPASDKIFKAKFVGKRLFGRGSADTKSSVAVLLELSKNNIELIKKKSLFSIVGDEEIGGQSSKALIAKLPNLQFAVFGEPTNLKVINEAKGIIQIKIVAKGKSAHGAKLWEGENAVINMTNLISEFSKKTWIDKPTKETTFNFSKIQGGNAINQVPDYCEAFVDIRYNPGTKPQTIIQKIRQHFKDCRLEILLSESPVLTSLNNIFVKQFLASIQKSGLKKLTGFEYFSSDARHCTALKIPAIVFGPVGENLHQENEWLDFKSLKKCLKVYENFLTKLS